MIRQDLVDYIKAQFEKGSKKEDINQTLLSAGWKAEDVAEAFRCAEQNIPIPLSPSKEPYSYQSGQSSQFAATLKSPTDILKEAWGIYKARFKTFVNVLFIQYIPILVLVFAGIIYAIASLVFKAESSGPAMTVLNWFLGIIVIIAMLAMIITALWGQAAMLYAVKDSDENIGAKESYRRGRHKILSVFWVGLLSGFIIMGGFLFFVIPGIIFSTWFSFAIMIVVAEDLGGMNALLKSKSYVTGYWWEIFWRFLFIGLVLFLINLIFLIPSWIINFIAQIANSSALIMIGAVINFAGSIVGFLLAPLTIIYTFLVYKNLKEIKGEINPVFTSGQKIKYVLAGLFGIIFMIGLFAIPIILVGFNSIRPQVWDAKRQSDIASFQTSLEYYADTHDNKYPASLDELLEKSAGINLSSIPTDPKTKLPYEYKQLKDGKDYELCATFDKGGKKCVSNSYYSEKYNSDSKNSLQKRDKFYADINEVKNLWSNGLYQDALDKANKTLPNAETDEEKAVAHYWIGLNNYKLKNYIIAETELNAALQLKPNYAAPYVTLAAIEMDSKANYSKGLEYANKCVEMDPKYAWCYNSKGSALYLLGQKDEAVTAFEQAVYLDPDTFVFRDNLTRARQGN